MSRITNLCLLLVLAHVGLCQGLENVLVETYHIEQRGVDEAPLVTYRIFMDLAPDHVLLAVYGDERNELEIRTTTTFFNDTVNGVKFADKLQAGRLATPPTAQDSWLTIKAASDRHWGVPKTQDPDGTILGCPPYEPPIQHGERRTERGGSSICVSDGLVEAPEIREVIEFKMPAGYLGKIDGSVIHTMDGAWAVLGGAKGTTEDNLVLVAQISTTGELGFKLNAQVKHQGGVVPTHYVSTNAAPGEVHFPALRYGTLR